MGDTVSESPQVRYLSSEFARRVLEGVDCDLSKLSAIDAANVHMQPSCCASHDYCDANNAMELALLECGMSTSPDHERDHAEVALVIIDAWITTRANGFCKTLKDHPMKLFAVATSTHSLASMLESNADDQEFTQWLYTASVGDEFLDGEGCIRIA